MKIDLHVHTVRNRFLDSDFSYKNEFLEKYVDSNNIDAIAITNHNLFDEANFNEAKEALKDSNCLVLPGIEVSLETGHILVIFEDSEDGINQLKKISSYILRLSHTLKFCDTNHIHLPLHSHIFQNRKMYYHA